jgi:mono/diheme cytochrome c family protein
MAAALSTAGLLTLQACKLEPETPELRYSLNERAIEQKEDLARDRVAQDHLRGALEMLYGTPSNPGYLRLAEWIDDDYDPNWGDLELSDEEVEAIHEENRRRYAGALEAIAAGRFEDVLLQREAIGLRADWREALAEWRELSEAVESGEAEASELAELEARIQEDWPGYIVEWYPSLRESAELYRQQCLHCHGVEGGGDGPTADFLNPRPRDYRPGKFKFTALNNKARPRREDLLHVLQEGIYLTAMPSFARLSRAQLHGLVDYVRLLGQRGETEVLLIDEYEASTGIPYETIEETYRFVHDRWQDTADELIAFDGEVPEATPERIAHGRELFLDENGANCVKCHGVDARGQGLSAKEVNPDTGELEWAKDDWGNEISPRDLTRGIFRFGRRPIDLYRRVYAGINGTPMPAHFGMDITQPDGTKRPLDENDVWDLVHFVRSLSTHPLPVAQSAGTAGH